MGSAEDMVGKRLGKQLFEQHLKNPKLRVIKCNGWNGVGRWKIVEEAAKIAMESQFFDILVFVKLSKKEWSPRNIQIRIAEQLGIELPMIDGVGGSVEDTDYMEDMLADAIHGSLKDKNFLFVVGDAYDNIDFGWVGVPNVKTRRRTASKIVLIGDVFNDNRTFDLDFDKTWHMQWLPDLSIQVLELILDEAAEVAHSSRGNITFEAIMACLFYLFLLRSYSGKEKWLIRYLMVEGLITASSSNSGIGGREETGSTIQEEEVLEERVMKPLLKELCDRSFMDEASMMMPSIIYGAMKTLGAYNSGERFQYKFQIKKDFQLLMERHDKWRAIVMTISTKGGGTNVPPSPEWPCLSTLVITSEPGVVQFDIPPTFFMHMRRCLRVLHLYFTPITSLPPSISSLCNLRLLRLQGIDQLKAIPTFLQDLEKLEFLDLSYCRNLEKIEDETFERMNNLRVLNLESSGIQSFSLSSVSSLQELQLAGCKSLIEIPEKSFGCCMQGLQLLNLSGASSLKTLPSSMSNLVGLKKLNLNYCLSLKTTGLGVGAQSLRNLPKLEVLDLGYCVDLEDIQELSFGDVVPNIKYIDLTHVRTLKRLSFKGCKRLEHLDISDLISLEMLNLSGIPQINKFHFNTSRSCALKHLEMLPIKYNGIEDVLFEGLNWDYSDVGARDRMWVADTYIFENLPINIFNAKCFSRFHIRISSSTAEKPSMPMPMGNIQNNQFQRNQFAYKDIYSHKQAHLLPNFRSTYDQHLEIFRCKVPLKPLQYLLSHAKLLTLYDNSSNGRLIGDLDHVKSFELKECRIGSCQDMETIFDSTMHGDIILKCLEVLWVSDLPKLTTVCKSFLSQHVKLKFLKHMHLERCPKLVTVFTSGCYLESLETLEIKFCSRLQVVFGSTLVSLQRLRSLCLWQLPKLKSIGSQYLPNLQMMRVKGCRMLKKLPFRAHFMDKDHSSYDASNVVEIEGEMNWRNNLQWENEDDDLKERPVRFLPARSPVLVKQRK